MNDWTGWLQLVAVEGLLVVALLAVFDGARRLVRDGFSRRPALMLALGLVLPVLDASNSVHVVRNVQRLQGEKLAALNVYGREPDGGWEKAPLTPEQRTTMSTAVATIHYKFLGRRLQLIDDQGRRVQFEPSADVQAEREQILRDEKGAEDAGASAFDRGVRLFVGTAGFLLAGVAVGAWQRRRR